MNLVCQNKRAFEPPSSPAGFTLLEVIISMAILTFITLGIYQTTIETYKLRDSLSAEGDFNSGIRLALNIVEQDIEMIYSPIISVPSTTTTANQAAGQPNPQQAAALLADDLAVSSKFWSPATSSSGLRPSHFMGAEDKISFISSSHVRIYRDSPESDFSKISYELQKDQDNRENPDTYVLVRTENPNAFNLEETVGASSKDKFSHSYPLLHGIKKLTYSYFQRDGNTWKILKSWDSEHEETKNIYPDVIEINIEAIGRKRDSFVGKFKFRPEIPLNGLNSST